MKIIDTNTINHIFNSNIKLHDYYYIAPDVKEESEITEMIFGKQIPTNIKDVSKEQVFDSVSYLRNYKDLLNRYRGRSFYNMSGFGDISILATLKTLGDALQAQNRRLFSEMDERLVVITEDDDLTKKITQEFNKPTSSWKVAILRNDAIT